MSTIIGFGALAAIADIHSEQTEIALKFWLLPEPFDCTWQAVRICPIYKLLDGIFASPLMEYTLSIDPADSFTSHSATIATPGEIKQVMADLNQTD